MHAAGDSAHLPGLRDGRLPDQLHRTSTPMDPHMSLELHFNTDSHSMIEHSNIYINECDVNTAGWGRLHRL